MVFLADENFPMPSILLLRAEGIVVHSILETTPGIDDLSIIRQAQQHGLAILTFDRDYGDYIFKDKIPDPPAVVFSEPKASRQLLPQFASSQP